MTYEKEGYSRVPERLKEASGISGYTVTGVVHTCLYSDYAETVDETYLSQSEHVTRSIEKLMNNPELFINVLNVPKVYEWHLNVYEYFDTRILCHLKIKRDEAQLARAEHPEKYPHISDYIDIRVVAPDCFLLQIRSILSSRLHKKHIQIKLPKAIKSELIVTDVLKHNFKNFTDLNDEDVDALVEFYSGYYSSGLYAMEILKNDNATILTEVSQLAEIHQKEIRIKTIMNCISTFTAYSALFDDFYASFNKNFESVFTYETMLIFKHYFLAAWILDGTARISKSA
jgi:hypothetical protein